MKKCLLLTFDLTRHGEPVQSLAAGSLLAALRPLADLEVSHISINVWEDECRRPEFVSELVDAVRAGDFNAVACSAYVWSDFLLKPFLSKLRQSGYCGCVIIGGYQASYSDNAELPYQYPEADVFVKGYAENSLGQAFRNAKPARPVVIESSISSEDFLRLPSPYLTGEISVAYGQDKVRVETNRGCPYKCTFCAYRDVGGSPNRVLKSTASRIRDEIDFLCAKQVGKINLVDPVFNLTTSDVELLEYMIEIGLKSHISLQVRPERIQNLAQAEQFLNAVSQLNATLEFGIQTLVQKESDAVKRNNHLEAFPVLTQELHRRGIDFELSLIYGLPHQTLDSFQQSVEAVLQLAPPRVYAFPLMLYPGTELFAQKAEFGIEEQVMGEFGIPHVVASHSFTKDDWWQMKALADTLSVKPERIASPESKHAA